MRAGPQVSLEVKGDSEAAPLFLLFTVSPLVSGNTGGAAEISQHSLRHTGGAKAASSPRDTPVSTHGTASATVTAVLPVVLQGAGARRAVAPRPANVPVIALGTPLTAPAAGVMLTVLQGGGAPVSTNVSRTTGRGGRGVSRVSPDTLPSLRHSSRCGCGSDTGRTDAPTSTSDSGTTTQTAAGGKIQRRSPKGAGREEHR